MASDILYAWGDAIVTCHCVEIIIDLFPNDLLFGCTHASDMMISSLIVQNAEIECPNSLNSKYVF